MIVFDEPDSIPVNVWHAMERHLEELPVGMPLPSLGDKLRAWRQRNGLPQAEAARKLGVAVGTLRNWEQSRKRPQGLAMASILRTIGGKIEAEV